MVTGRRVFPADEPANIGPQGRSVPDIFEAEQGAVGLESRAAGGGQRGKLG